MNGQADPIEHQAVSARPAGDERGLRTSDRASRSGRARFGGVAGLTAAIIMLVLVPALLIAWWFAAAARDEVVDRTGRKLAQAAQFGSALYAQALLAVERALTVEPFMVAVVAPHPEACQTLLRREVDSHPFVSGSAIVARNGRIICDSTGRGRGVDVSDRDYLRWAVTQDSLAVGSPVVERIANTRILPVARRLGPGAALPGPDDEPVALVAVLSVEDFVRRLKEAVQSSQGLDDVADAVMVVDRDNRVVAASHESIVPGTSIVLAFPGAAADDLATLMTEDGGRFLAGISAPSPGGIRVVVMESWEAITGPADQRFLWVLGAMAGVALLGAAIAGLLASRLVVLPLLDLAQAARDIERGERPTRLARGPLFGELEEFRRTLARMAEEVQRREADLSSANSELDRLARTDALTGIANRRGFEEALAEAWSRARHDRTSIALLLLDIDHFKLYNDAYGHPAGDKCLARVGRTLAHLGLRQSDLVARLGGEEFAVLLPGADLDCGLRIGERVRAEVEGLAILHGGSPIGVVTVSVGVAAKVPGEGEAPETVIALADKALYAAKASGRNAVAGGDTPRRDASAA